MYLDLLFLNLSLITRNINNLYGYGNNMNSKVTEKYKWSNYKNIDITKY